MRFVDPCTSFGVLWCPCCVALREYVVYMGEGTPNEFKYSECIECGHTYGEAIDQNVVYERTPGDVTTKALRIEARPVVPDEVQAAAKRRRLEEWQAQTADALSISDAVRERTERWQSARRSRDVGAKRGHR